MNCTVCGAHMSRAYCETRECFIKYLTSTTDNICVEKFKDMYVYWFLVSSILEMIRRIKGNVLKLPTSAPCDINDFDIWCGYLPFQNYNLPIKVNSSEITSDKDVMALFEDYHPGFEEIYIIWRYVCLTEYEMRSEIINVIAGKITMFRLIYPDNATDNVTGDATDPCVVKFIGAHVSKWPIILKDTKTFLANNDHMTATTFVTAYEIAVWEDRQECGREDIGHLRIYGVGAIELTYHNNIGVAVVEYRGDSSRIRAIVECVDKPLDCEGIGRAMKSALQLQL